ncbi:hypothetical protein IFM89_017535 [Coptis chinensis]|uniref:Chaperone DnaJ C-terminal domain-containing protein n=1 Tax=Coptis chinensis TaxID=261450 RepID=A0A835LZU0_9MAGN|nr:hypothetical protein IFM89_017535 [Coptis chinensis]
MEGKNIIDTGGSSGKSLKDIATSSNNRRQSFTPSLLAKSEVTRKEKLPNIDDKGNMLDISEYIEDIYSYYWLMEAQQDRSDYVILKAENEGFRLEAALRSISCLNCGGPAILGEMSFDEQHLRIENVRLKEEVLSDDEKRSLYDRYGESGLKGAGMGTGDFSNPFDLFESLFENMGGMGGGGRGTRTRAVDGEDECHMLMQSWVQQSKFQQYVDGMVDLKIPSGTQPGTTLVMAKKGVPLLNKSNLRGDQLVRVQVEIPKRLSGVKSES